MESKQWRPSRWTENATRLRMRRVYKWALRGMYDMIGPYRADIIYAELMANMKSEQSRVELLRRGVKLLG